MRIKAGPSFASLTGMDVEHRITSDDAKALTAALAASGERDAAFLVTGAVSLAALTLALPFSLTNEGGLRIVAALLLALLGSWIATRLIDWWRTARARWLPLESITGLEAGDRRLTFALEGVREISHLGERVFRWPAFEDAAETENWIALRVSDREVVVFPREVLNRRELAEATTLTALIGRGRKK